MKTTASFRRLSTSAVLLAGLLLAGCGGSKNDAGVKTVDSAQAASQLEQAFEKADTAVKQNVAATSQALRNREYEKAIVSLYTVKQAPGITLEQGMAIHSSSITLELELIKAIEHGDENAKRAYQLLKQVKRN